MTVYCKNSYYLNLNIPLKRNLVVFYKLLLPSKQIAIAIAIFLAIHLSNNKSFVHCYFINLIW